MNTICIGCWKYVQSLFGVNARKCWYKQRGSSGGGGGGSDAAAPGDREEAVAKWKGGKKSDFLRLTNFKLLSQMKGNSIKARNFKVRNLCYSGHCAYRPGQPAAQLHRPLCYKHVTVLPPFRIFLYSADTMPCCCSYRNKIPSHNNQLHWTLHAADHPHRVLPHLTHCGRVTQICVFNTVKLGTSASSP